MGLLRAAVYEHGELLRVLVRAGLRAVRTLALQGFQRIIGKLRICEVIGSRTVTVLSSVRISMSGSSVAVVIVAVAPGVIGHKILANGQSNDVG
jgi:hypothetical protein